MVRKASDSILYDALRNESEANDAAYAKVQSSVYDKNRNDKEYRQQLMNEYANMTPATSKDVLDRIKQFANNNVKDRVMQNMADRAQSKYLSFIESKQLLPDGSVPKGTEIVTTPTGTVPFDQPSTPTSTPTSTPATPQFNLNAEIGQATPEYLQSVTTSYYYYKNLFPNETDSNLVQLAKNDVVAQQNKLLTAQGELGGAYDTSISSLKNALETQATQAMGKYAPQLERAYGARGLQESGVQGEALRRTIESLAGQSAGAISGLEQQKAMGVANLTLSDMANQYNLLNQRLGSVGTVSAQNTQNALSQAMQNASLGQQNQQFYAGLNQANNQFNTGQAYNQQMFNYNKQLQEQAQREAEANQWVNGLLGIGKTAGGVALMTNPATAGIGAALLGSNYYGGSSGNTGVQWNDFQPQYSNYGGTTTNPYMFGY